MTYSEEAGALRRHLKQLANEFDAKFCERYALHFWVPEEPSLDIRIKKKGAQLLRWLGLKPPPPPPPPEQQLEPWLTGLKHVTYEDEARPLLIWAVDVDRDELRSACARIRAWQSGAPGWAPVLVTDVADFAHFSRLSWLVEYVPSIEVSAPGYASRKIRYLAWRYRDTPVLPIRSVIKGGAPEECIID